MKKTLLAVAVIVEFNGKILLAKRTFDPYKDKFEIPGGFVEEGESVENAAVREILEETGLNIKIKGVLGVYSYPTSNIRKCSLAIAFVAAASSDKVKISSEAKELGWFDYKKIKADNLGYDHGMLLDHFKEWKKTGKTFWLTK